MAHPITGEKVIFQVETNGHFYYLFCYGIPGEIYSHPKHIENPPGVEGEFQPSKRPYRMTQDAEVEWLIDNRWSEVVEKIKGMNDV